jgi:hypothetical protein
LDNWCITLGHEPCTGCLEQTSDATAQCSPGPHGPSGCYKVSIPVVNNTMAPVEYASIKITAGGGYTSPAVHKFASPLAPSDTGTIEFMWCPFNHTTGCAPPAFASFDIAPIGPDGAVTCCTTPVRIVPEPCPPAPCLQVPKAEAICDPYHEKGSYRIRMDVRHPHPNTPVDVFIVPEGTANAHFKTYGTLGAAWQDKGTGHTRLPAVALNTCGWVHFPLLFWISDAVPASGQVCFWVHMSAATTGDEPCCMRRVCVQVPDCG